MPPPSPYPRTLGVTYLAGWLAGNSRLLDQLLDDYSKADLLIGVSWVAGVLAQRLAELDEVPIETVINTLVHVAAARDHQVGDEPAKEPA